MLISVHYRKSLLITRCWRKLILSPPLHQSPPHRPNLARVISATRNLFNRLSKYTQNYSRNTVYNAWRKCYTLCWAWSCDTIAGWWRSSLQCCRTWLQSMRTKLEGTLVSIALCVHDYTCSTPSLAWKWIQYHRSSYWYEPSNTESTRIEVNSSFIVDAVK